MPDLYSVAVYSVREPPVRARFFTALHLIERSVPFSSYIYQEVRFL